MSCEKCKNTTKMFEDLRWYAGRLEQIINEYKEEEDDE